MGFLGFIGFGGGATGLAQGATQAYDGMDASGGLMTEYPEGGVNWRCHIFTASGSFTVNNLSTNPTIPNALEYLVVAGGGGGGGSNTITSGGGGGGVRSNSPKLPAIGSSPRISTAFTAVKQTYPVTVGAGGKGGPPNGDGMWGANGGASQFGPPTGAPTSQMVYATGGGGGRANHPPIPPGGRPGGSGGGGAGNWPNSEGPAGETVASPDGLSPTVQGHDGGLGGNSPESNWGNGGGGGAGGEGGDYGAGSNPANGGYGGNGVVCRITGPNGSSDFITGAPGPSDPSNQKGWYAGGGGGQGYVSGTPGEGGGPPSNPGNGPYSGGAAAPPSNASVKGNDGWATSGGGGSAAGIPAGSIGGNGGSGCVVVRYAVGTLNTAKASGGTVNYYGGKTIHTFLGTGTFTAPSTFSETCEYVLVGGGGGGFTGGGGAGGYRTGTVPVSGPVSHTVTIGAGGMYANGSASQIPTFPVVCPGGGSSLSGPGGGAQSGASGGGGVQSGSGSTGAAASPNSDPDRFGYPGGNATPSDKTGGGGGGAGGPGNNKAQGGIGKQLPATFRDPTGGFQGDNFPDYPLRPGNPTSPGWWVGGGGAGTVYTTFDPPHTGPQAYGPTATGCGGAGGGGNRNISDPRYPEYGVHGMQNTGGGAAGGTPMSNPVTSAKGGSGVCLIAYPT